MDKSLNPLNHSTFLGGGSPKTSKKQKMVSFSVPDHLSHGLSMNLHGPGPLDLSGTDSLSQPHSGSSAAGGGGFFGGISRLAYQMAFAVKKGHGTS